MVSNKVEGKRGYFGWWVTVPENISFLNSLQPFSNSSTAGVWLGIGN